MNVASRDSGEGGAYARANWSGEGLCCEVQWKGSANGGK